MRHIQNNVKSKDLNKRCAKSTRCKWCKSNSGHLKWKVHTHLPSWTGDRSVSNCSQCSGSEHCWVLSFPFSIARLWIGSGWPHFVSRLVPCVKSEACWGYPRKKTREINKALIIIIYILIHFYLYIFYMENTYEE